jgi:hypothetical protein
MREIEERFGQETEIRRVQMESLAWLVDLAQRAGVLRLIVNGSYVTDEPEPNDVDCLLFIGPGFPRDRSAEQEILTGLPFLHVEFVEQAVLDEYIEVVFATDRKRKPKGMIEVVL